MSTFQALHYSPGSRQRIRIGIGWDVKEEMAERPEAFHSAFGSTKDGSDVYGEEIEVKVGTVTETFDLDLVCLIYNREGVLIDAVSPFDNEVIDRSGKIYHSGDETKGVSSGDDEAISVELKDLPEDIHGLVFFATVQSRHDYSQIPNTEFCVVDSMTNEDFDRRLLPPEDGRGKTAYVYLALRRGGETGWQMRIIDEYRIDKSIADWSEEVKGYLKT